MTSDPGRDEPDRPLEGLGRFTWKLSMASVVAIAGVVLVLLLRGDGEGAKTAASASRAVPPPAPTAPAGTTAPPAATAPAGAAVVRDATTIAAETPVGRDIDRRYAAGELAEAQRRFEPCQGGDVRRVAWIDPQQRVRKLMQFRGTGLVVEQWFDDEGRLREAVVRTTAAGREWTRRISLDERGREALVDTPSGVVPDEPPPPLVRGDPGSAFFSGPGCNG